MIPDKETLRWVGMLGHTYAVIVTGTGGNRRCSLETCSLDSARRDAAEADAAGRDPVIYRQVRAGKWRRIPERRAARAA